MVRYGGAGIEGVRLVAAGVGDGTGSLQLVVEASDVDTAVRPRLKIVVYRAWVPPGRPVPPIEPKGTDRDRGINAAQRVAGRIGAVEVFAPRRPLRPRPMH
jgi:hypothetical protein